jgi:hypothetical protein
MEPYALELPNPTASRCTVHSFNPDEQYFVLATDAVTPRWWYFQNNTLYHDDEGKPAAGLVFAIRSLLNNKYLNCQGWSSKLNPNQTYYDPDYWFDCVVDESIPNMRNWKANYNAKTSILSVGVTWGCDELSPGNS